MRHLLATTSLWYANGPLHLGHLVEAVQADIWCRFQRQRGHQCTFISGSDAHGTAIMLSAAEQGKTAEQAICHTAQAHQHSLQQFHISLDYFGHTHQANNQALTYQIYQRLQAAGDIKTRIIEQAYDTEKQQFLADRFIKGQCPRCQADDQYGDHCDACGATYEATELLQARSTLSNTPPIQKPSTHYFFQLQRHQDAIANWIEQALPRQMVNKVNEWLSTGLKDWDISRDGPYFGFPIPDTTDKYFYVWLDAPIGYMACHQSWCEQQQTDDFAHTWQRNSNVELHHFIGKDIINFHALFWPALLLSSDHRLPTRLHVHGFMTINGQKMSKSRKTFITADHYLKHGEAEPLRYYIAAKLSGHVEDIDLNFADLVARINSDLVGKTINLASRCAKFINQHFDHQLAPQLHAPQLQALIVGCADEIADAYEQGNSQKAIRQIMSLADQANQYIDQHKPWQMMKSQDQQELVQAVCTQGLNLFRCLMIYLKPVLPVLASQVESFLNSPPLTWSDLDQPLLAHQISPFTPLMQRLKPEAFDALLSHST